MTRFVGLANGVFVNPDHVTSVAANDGFTVVTLVSSEVTTPLSVGEVVDCLEEALPVD